MDHTAGLTSTNVVQTRATVGHVQITLLGTLVNATADTLVFNATAARTPVTLLRVQTVGGATMAMMSSVATALVLAFTVRLAPSILTSVLSTLLRAACMATAQT